jgi:hypothetical protein
VPLPVTISELLLKPALLLLAKSPLSAPDSASNVTDGASACARALRVEVQTKTGKKNLIPEKAREIPGQKTF